MIMETEQGKDRAKEYYGSDAGMPDDILEQRLASAKETFERLMIERERRKAFTMAERFADRLHRLLHLGADCDFYYSEWPLATGCRAEFRGLAEQMLRVLMDGSGPRDDLLDRLIGWMENTRFGSVQK